MLSVRSLCGAPTPRSN